MRTLVAVASAVFCLPVTKADAQPTCDTVLRCAQMAVEAAQKAQESARNAIPRGALMAFRLDACPAGWEGAKDLSGRVIVGAGEGNQDQNSRPLTRRTLGQIGGEELHTLSVEELPSHTHSAQGYIGVDAGRHDRGDGLFGGTSSATGPAGGGQPHNNMQPFIALTYCEKK